MRLPLAVALSSLLVVTAFAQAESEPNEKLAELSWMVGTWESTRGSPDGPVNDRYVYSWTLDGAFLGFTYEARQGGEVVQRGRGMYGYDEDRKQIVGFVFGTDGGIGRTTMTPLGDRKWKLAGTTSGPSPWKKYEGIITREDDDRIVMDMRFFDAPMEKMTATYVRAGAKQAAARSRYERSDAPKLSFVVPANWKKEKTTSRMRLDQYEIPGKRPASCVVYFFGEGSGGGVAANVRRWKGQFQDAVMQEPERIAVDKGVRATLVDITGVYAAETRPGSGERVSESGWRMLGAIVEAPGGPLYIKAVGPKATLDPAVKDFREWVQSYRVVK